MTISISDIEKKKKHGHEEEDLQIACVKWFSLQYRKYAMLLHHSPNGGTRRITEAKRFKAMGTKAGFPDLQLCLPNKEYHGLFIELKSRTGRQEPSQKAMQEALEGAGYRYVIVNSINSFIECVNNYLNS